MIASPRQLSLRRLPIGVRLSMIAVLLAAAVFGVSVIAWHALDTENAMAANVSRLSRAQTFHQDADMMHDALKADVYEILVRDVDNAEGEEMLASLRSNTSRFREDLAALAGFSFTPELAASVAATRRAAEGYILRAEHVATLASHDRPAARQVLADFEREFDKVLVTMDDQTNLLGAEIATHEQQSQKAAQEAKRWIIISGLFVVVSITLLVNLISRSIYRSVQQIGAVAQTIAAGDLDVRSEVVNRDVLGTLAEAINGMADNLQKTIGKMRADSDRDVFSNQLAEALEMAHTEADAHAVIARGMQAVSGKHAMELLLSDSSRVHLERATQHPTEGAPCCDVGPPFNCAAVRRGAAIAFPDSEALNACPRLRGRAAGRISAVCVPVTFMGRAMGVLHASGPVSEPLVADEIAQLAVLGGQTGSRIGTIRAFQKTQVQASTDSLTGLLNRRSLEQELRELVKAERPFAFILADLDRFKALNDTHGHQAGDNALRVFSEVVRGSAREGDLIGRWGGEEFVFVLANASAAQACDWADRLREKLAAALSDGKSIAFTASFGIADSSMSTSSEELQRIADAALYRSKDEGRDRATIASASGVGQPQPRHATEHPAGINVRLLARQD